MGKARKLTTLEELSHLTGHTYRTVRDRLVTLEPEKQDGRSRLYDSTKALALIYDRGEPKDLDLSRERASLARMQTRKLELEVAKLEARLVDADVPARLAESIIVTFRSRLLAMPRSAALEANPENPKHAEAVLDREARAILEELVSDTSLDEVLARTTNGAGERVGLAPPAA